LAVAVTTAFAYAEPFEASDAAVALWYFPAKGKGLDLAGQEAGKVVDLAKYGKTIQS